MADWKGAKKFPLTFSCDAEHEAMLNDLAAQYGETRSAVILELIGSAYLLLTAGGPSNG